MKHKRMQHALVAVGQDIFAIGGRTTKFDPVSSIEVYSPQQDQWTLLDGVSLGPESLSVHFVDGQNIWLFGLRSSSGSMFSNVLRFDAETRSLTQSLLKGLVVADLRPC